MQPKKTLALMTIVTGGCLLAASPSLAAPRDSLWCRAVARKDTGEVWLPGKMVMREEELDGKGVAKSCVEQWMEMKDRGDGSFAYETFKIVEDGEEVALEELSSAPEASAETQAESKSGDQDQGSGKDEGTENGPGESISYTFSAPDIFDAEAQDHVTVKPLGQRRQIGNRECIGYEFVTEREQKSYRETLMGVAWVEEPTGIPVEVKYTARPLPKRVKRAETTVHYQEMPDGSFCTAKIITEGTGGFLIIKKSFRMTLEFLEYRKLQKK